MSPQNGLKIAPGTPPGRPREAPGRAQADPRRPRDPPKTAQDSSKRAPGPPRGRFGGLQDGQKWSPNGLRIVLPTRTPPGCRFGLDFGPVWARFWADLGSILGRLGVRFGVDFGVGNVVLRWIWGPFVRSPLLLSIILLSLSVSLYPSRPLDSKLCYTL